MLKMYEGRSAYMKSKYGYPQLQWLRSLAWAVKAENPKWIEEARQKQQKKLDEAILKNDSKNIFKYTKSLTELQQLRMALPFVKVLLEASTNPLKERRM